MTLYSCNDPKCLSERISSGQTRPAESDLSTDSDDIAIIGFSFELPGADSEESFWDLMVAGECAASEFPPHRLSSRGVKPFTKGENGAQKACFLQRDLGAFDARFFGFTPDEAAAADPQQRLLLETTYRALENAGVSLEKIDGTNTAVYTGCFTSDYSMSMANDAPTVGAAKYTATGQAQSMLSNKISSAFNLTGPSVTLDTACSSSLVALDMAFQSLRQGKSSMAIVTGSNLMLSPHYFILLENFGFLSPDGVCHSFDSRANGYGRGEGVGVLILKPVQAAVRDGTRFFEAHGTGTPVGDSLEAMAIGGAFGPGRGEDNPIIIGAVKANIGHLEGAAGIAGIIKSILVLEKGIIPPISGLKDISKSIDADFLKLQFPKTAVSWPSRGLRRASVNSFGFGGTNAHIVLDDAFHYLSIRELQGSHHTIVDTPGAATYSPRLELPPANVSISGNGSMLQNPLALNSVPRLFVWSASGIKSASSLVEAYREYLQKYPDLDVDDLAYTLSQKRSLFAWRIACVAESLPQLARQLLSPITPIQARSNIKVAFIFTGQGAQWLGMGKELLAFPVFRDILLEADKCLGSMGCDWSSITVLQAGHTDIDKPQVAQPICTILQIAVVRVLRALGIYPATTVGHSSGEIAAAYAVGAISQLSAWKLAYFRGLHSGHMASDPGPSGSMMAVGLSETAVQPYLDHFAVSSSEGVLALACVNSPQNVTISGDEHLIQELSATLERDGVFARRLRVPVAYHSPHMARVSEPYRNSVGDLEPGEKLPYFATMISSVTGHNVTAADLQKSDYWVENLISTVRFSTAIQKLMENSAKKMAKKLNLDHRCFASVSELVEIGPHSALQSSIRQILETNRMKDDITYSSVLIRNRSATTTLLETVGRLHCRGLKLDLAGANGLSSNTSVQSERATTMLTGLPEYSYDHSRSYWMESRLTKHMRLPPLPDNEFLGTPLGDWNPLEPRWRKILSISRIPWLRDHEINGEIIYPAAGMLVMAMEALALISDDSEIIEYEIRDATMLSAILIPPDDGEIEVQFRLKPPLDSSKAVSWAEFSLFYCRNGSWFEACRGSIKGVRLDDDHDLKAEAREITDIGNQIADANASSAYSSEIDMADLYAKFAKSGYRYGPSFQGVNRARRNNNQQAVGDVTIASLGSPTVVHPCTLDTMLHLILPPAMLASKAQETWIPTYLASMRISSKGFKTCFPEEGLVQTLVSTERVGVRRYSAAVQALGHGDGGAGTFRLESLQLSMVSSGPEGQGAQTQPKRLCYDMVYKPDLTLLDMVQTAQYIHEDCPSPESAPIDMQRTLRLYLMTLFARTLADVSESELPADPPHLRKQYHWMSETIASAHQQISAGVPMDWAEHAGDAAFESLCTRVEAMGHLGALYVGFGAHMPAILRGTVDGLELLADSLSDYYRIMVQNLCLYGPLHRYLDALVHKEPAMRILEVGAGTGATTRYLLDTLVQHADSAAHTFSRFARYDFTDVSRWFLQKAEQEFANVPKMHFGVFDVEKEPVNQGYEEHSYDLVVAVNVLHATKSLQGTLSNIRWLLRDGGKLMIMEITEPASAAALLPSSIFGLLPGWWLATECWRQKGPCATVPQWDRELRESGFTGVDLTLDDFPSAENHLMSLLVSTAVRSDESGVYKQDGLTPVPSADSINEIRDKPVFIISGWEESIPSHLASLAGCKLQELGVKDVRVRSFAEATEQNDIHEGLVLIIQDGTWLSLAQLNGRQFDLFRETLTRSGCILWLANTRSLPEKDLEEEIDEVSPIGAVQGLARALRMERHGLIFATVSVNTKTCTSPATLSSLLGQALYNWLKGAAGGEYERELVQTGELLHIPRIYACPELDTAIHVQVQEAMDCTLPFGERTLRLQQQDHGFLDTLYWEEDPGETTVRLSPEEVEIDVRAVGVNSRDCLIASGRVDQDVETMGTEYAGIVRNAGASCTRLKIGDRVLASGVGTFRGRKRCVESVATRIPDAMDFQEAASLPTNFNTAYHALVRLAHLMPGESVLIHSAAGGTGQAAVQVAQCCGADIIATVGSEAKRDLLTARYGIQTNRIMNSRGLSFSRDLRRVAPRGVDVILNSLAGDALTTSWEWLAPYGRFVDIGKMDIYSRRNLPISPFARNVSFHTMDIATITLERPHVIQEAQQWVLGRFGEGKLEPVAPLNRFSASDMQEALRYVQSDTNAGKAVVAMDANEPVSAVVKPSTNWSFSSQATYVISGGLGAQGRYVARWMVSRGARHLVLMSRSGPDKNEGLVSFVDELRTSGATTYCPRCDISEPSSIAAVMEYCTANMPPIKGCIQAATVYRDSVFSTMSHEQWSECFGSKVKGSWNLHQQLPRNLDFFVQFSSTSGIIGAFSQVNYAAGNTYQDELARYRLSRGEQAVSINFSLMSGAGFAVDNRNLAMFTIRTLQVMELEQTEIVAVLDHFCNTEKQQHPHSGLAARSQLVLGLGLPANSAAQGLDVAPWMQEPMFRNLHQITGIATAAGGNEDRKRSSPAVHDLVARAKSATSPEEASLMVAKGLAARLCSLLSLDFDTFDLEKPLHAHGVDSLIAVEIRNWFLRTLEVDIAIFEILGGATSTTLGHTAAEKIMA